MIIKLWQNLTSMVTKLKLFIINCSHIYLFSATQQQQVSLIAMEDIFKHTKGILDPRIPIFSKSGWTLRSSWSLFLPSLTICSCCDTHAASYWILWVERILWVFHSIPTQIHQIITFSSDKRLTLAGLTFFFIFHQNKITMQYPRRYAQAGCQNLFKIYGFTWPKLLN